MTSISSTCKYFHPSIVASTLFKFFSALETHEKYSKVTISGGQYQGLARDGHIQNDARCEMLIFYCKLILLEMSHDSSRQQEIIQKNGVKILESLEQFGSQQVMRFYRNYLTRHTDQFLSPSIQLKQLERLFRESTISFCIGIRNILYTSLVPFLVREMFNRLLLIWDSQAASARGNKNRQDVD